MQEDDLGHVQVFLMTDIEGGVDGSKTIEGGVSKQEEFGSRKVSATAVYCKVGSSNKEGVNGEVADHPCMLLIEEVENSDGKAEQQ